MWFIKRLSFMDSRSMLTSHSITFTKYAIIGPWPRMSGVGNLEVILENMDNGKKFMLSAITDDESLYELFERLIAFKPYGFGVLLGRRGVYFATETSLMSYQFLDLVDQVGDTWWQGREQGIELVNWFVKENKRYNFNGFRALDKHKMFYSFELNPQTGAICSLLEVIQLCPAWWHGDKYFIFHDGNKESFDYAYQVDFNNLEEAKRFVVKSAMLEGLRYSGMIQKRFEG